MSDLLHRFLFPDVDRHLLTDDGEYVIDEVEKHWIVTVVPVLALVASVLCFLSIWQLGHGWIIGLVVGLVCQGWAIRELYLAHMDRFVITNMRVFRVHGIADKHMATMPMSRILDITVEQPLMGQIFGYGHFIFESAAQDQGLRVISHVGHPEQRDLIIQRATQQAGLRPNIAHPR